jgi:membrane protease YdiL (CAAX protease family)
MTSPRVRPVLIPIYIASIYCLIPILLVGVLSLFWNGCYKSIYFFGINSIGALLGILLLKKSFRRDLKDHSAFAYKPLPILLGLVLGVGFYVFRWHLLPDAPPEAHANYLYMLRYLIRDASYLRILALALPLTLLFPVFEEIAFRGMVQSAFRRIEKGVAGPVLSTALLFTLLHVTPSLDPWPSINLFLLAVTLSVLRAGTGSLLPSMALHITYNTLEIVLHVPR